MEPDAWRYWGTEEACMARRTEDAPSKVLVALDGSPAAATALPWGRVIAAQLGIPVTILHVASDPVPGLALAERLRGTLQAGESVEMRAGADDPAAAILDTAADPAVALLVLTTHGRDIEPGRGLGGVAEAVIASVVRPVLLVRPETAACGGMPPHALHRLLFPLNGTPTTAAALAPAVALARQLDASIDLLYVGNRQRGGRAERGSIQGPRYVDRPYYEWPLWARELREWFCTCCAQGPVPVPVRAFYAQGAVGAEIVRFVVEQAADAVVLVRRSRLEPGHAPVLRSVLGQTPCPILLLSGPPSDVDVASLREPARQTPRVWTSSGT
jgi:nucleotide-binding universal stress UspA family protein